jgi:hypothetical protein
MRVQNGGIRHVRRKESRGGQEERFPPARLSARAEDLLAALGPDHFDIRVMGALMPMIFK